MTSSSAQGAAIAGGDQQQSGLDRWFEITKRGSSLPREVRGGLVTFFAMAYILALNPLIIGTATDKNGNLVSGAPKFTDAAQTVVDAAAVGQSIGMVAAATALVAGVMTILMGVVGRFPIGIATGLGLNAMLAYVVAPQMTWPQAMGLVVCEGAVVTLLVLTGFREAVFRAVPPSLRTAISVGIGLFITLVGLADAGIIRPGSPLVELGVGGSLVGWPIFVFVVTFVLLAILQMRRVRGAMLWAIFGGTVLAVILETIAKIGAVGEEHATGWALNVPAFPGWQAFASPDLSLIGKVDIIGGFAPDGNATLASVLTAALLVFSLLLADFFDTMGTVVAVGAEGGILNKDGEPPHLREILLIDSIAALAGGASSVSSNTSFVESTAGVAEGARTGFASVITGVGFLVALFITPVVNMVPSEAVAPVLVVVGFLMMTQVTEIPWNDMEIAIPAFVTIAFMPFSYSITVGIGAGFIMYVVLKVFNGKAAKVHVLMWVVAALFLIYFMQGLISGAVA
ncbi:NCS2 family permease [Propionimicrobium sp. PCR01-08-3]|uniref:NCS2 family permease n=1 Tax=Propionimicrobium sp. PCR01-08-3 TaxID=3052086 RepID=UPI00255CC934|nr:NCS2 family permease [Propionimicrobium sp. PCR01-08-3]WIY82874.1 NCS2 family permease [Propionimicrobium sp. PCR01-08-3]